MDEEAAAADESGSDDEYTPELATANGGAGAGATGGGAGNAQSGLGVGIGAVLEEDSAGYVRVARLIPGGPAERCGMVAAGDWLVEVPGRPSVHVLSLFFETDAATSFFSRFPIGRVEPLPGRVSRIYPSVFGVHCMSCGPLPPMSLTLCKIPDCV
jgi:hypothetical protein